MPSQFSANAKDLLSKLIVKDPKQRLGINGALEIKNHPFFENVRWEEVLIKKKKAPIIPTVTKPEDLRNFDRVIIMIFAIFIRNTWSSQWLRLQ